MTPGFGLPLPVPFLDDEELKKRLGIAAGAMQPAATGVAAPADSPSPPAARPTLLGRSPLVTPESAGMLQPRPEEVGLGPATQRYQEALGRPAPQLHGVKRVLDVIGQVAAPGIEQAIPGTPGYQQAQLGRLGRQAAAEQGIQKDVLGRKDVGSQIYERLGKAEQAPAERLESLNQAEAQLYQQRVAAGEDPMKVLKEITQLAQKPSGAEGELPLGDRVPDLNQALQARYQVLHPRAPLPPYLNLPATATQKDFDRVDKVLQQEEQALGTKAQQDQANAARQATLELARSNLELRKQGKAEAEGKQDKALREKILTYYKPAQDADTRLNLMRQSMTSALKGDQQAMVNLVANHVAMVMGMPRGKVPRVSHEMFSEAQQSAPFLQRIEARFDKDGYLTGVVLTPEQMQSMIKLGEETAEQEWAQANSSADYIGVAPDDRPKRTAGTTSPRGGGGEATVGSDEHVRQWKAKRGIQ